MRRDPVVAGAGGLGVFVGFLLAGTTQAHSLSPTNATPLTQTAFFVAVLCFEVAFVAGVCAAARALSCWDASVASSQDREVVRRCCLVSTSALGVAAVAWCAAMALAARQLVQPNSTTLVLGGTVMLISATAAFVVVYRLPMNLQDDLASPGERSSGRLGLVERSIDVVRRHPVLSCLVFAGLTAVPAMSHAETTVSGAVPWGLAQAGSVGLGFVVLGPLLGLRPRRSRFHRLAARRAVDRPFVTVLARDGSRPGSNEARGGRLRPWSTRRSRRARSSPSRRSRARRRSRPRST